MATDMLKKFCYPRGFYIYKIVQLKVIDSIVLNITIPSDTWSNEALFQIKQTDKLLSEIMNKKTIDCKSQEDVTIDKNQALEDAAHQYSCMKVEEETPYTDSLRKDTSKNFKAGAEWQKEQSANDALPTEEEIQKKANENADKYLKRFDTIAVFVGYIDGYKQALKDLGYE
jgi:hypothetical protein